MKPEDFDIQRLVEYLQGTTNTLSGALEELFPGMEEIDLTSDDHNFIDNEIFLCDECGWWCETSQRNGVIEDEQLCTDCHPEDEED